MIASKCSRSMATAVAAVYSRGLSTSAVHCGRRAKVHTPHYWPFRRDWVEKWGPNTRRQVGIDTLDSTRHSVLSLEADQEVLEEAVNNESAVADVSLDALESGKYDDQGGDVDLPRDQKFSFDIRAIRDKGYLRYQRPYTPPANIGQVFARIVSDVLGTPSPDGKQVISKNERAKALSAISLSDPRIKFNFLARCDKEFDHSVPNSMLCHIQTVGDVFQFYTRKVETRVPLDQMKDVDLPKNLHVTYEYTRINPAENPMFNYMDAFPHSNTIVTEVKYKKKYPNFIKKKVGDWKDY